MAETRLLDLIIDQELGTQLYEARQDIDAGNLWVRQLNTSLVLVGAQEDFNAATEVEIDDRTYRWRLYTVKDPSVAGNEDTVVAFGRMQKS
jgi:hypothetical protein